MNDLDDRLGALRDDPGLRPSTSAPSVDVLGARATRRRRRRRIATGAAVVVPVLLLVVAGIVVTRDEPRTDVVAGPPPSTLERQTAQITMGDVSGVTLTVTPNTGLRDGDVVEVRVEGLAQLPNAAIVMCTGDVTAETAMNACDFASTNRVDAVEPGNVLATGEDRVSVPRFIDITRDAADPNVAEPYDCATQPAGCVLAVGPISLPVRGVAVPLQFVDEEVAVPTVSATPSTGLTDGQTITVTGEGLQPNAIVAISLCRAAPYVGEEGSAPVCDGYTFEDATTDGSGRLRHQLRVWDTLYTTYGPVDCSTEACEVAVGDEVYRPSASTRLEFAETTEIRPQPALTITPPGPYTDGQVVTVTGTGFRPGIDVGDEIAQCPNDKDTALEERCGRSDISSNVVADDGTFTMQFRLQESLLFTGSCTDGPGCHLGWVISHGPTLAKVPLTFR